MIALDNAATVFTPLSGSPSGSFTCTGSNLILFAFIIGDVNNDNVTGATYNGVAMTLVAKEPPGNSNGRYAYLFYLLNPATGSHTLAATGSPDPLVGYASSYTGALQSGQPDASGVNNGSNVASIAKAITTVASNCWTVGGIYSSATHASLQSGTTLRHQDAGQLNIILVDSNGAVSPGSNSLGVNYSPNADNANIIVASFAPIPDSASISPSASGSASSSASASKSLSPSSSASASASRSLSPSASLSPSFSVSPSPSLGFADYTRGDNAALPANDNNLETNYSAQDVIDVSTKDDIRVSQTGTLEYMEHQFKNFVGSNTFCQVEWEGQTDLLPSSSTVNLQIYNRNTTTWDTIDSDNSSSINTDFILIAYIADLTNYKDASNVISCRIYQLAI